MDEIRMKVFLKNKKHNISNKNLKAAKEQRKECFMKIKKIITPGFNSDLKLVKDEKNALYLENAWNPLLKINAMTYDSTLSLRQMLKYLEREAKKMGKTTIQAAGLQLSKEDAENLQEYGYEVSNISEACVYAEKEL